MNAITKQRKEKKRKEKGKEAFLLLRQKDG
jgi:hypothetical protein